MLRFVIIRIIDALNFQSISTDTSWVKTVVYMISTFNNAFLLLFMSIRVSFLDSDMHFDGRRPDFSIHWYH